MPIDSISRRGPSKITSRTSSPSSTFAIAPKQRSEHGSAESCDDDVRASRVPHVKMVISTKWIDVAVSTQASPRRASPIRNASDYVTHTPERARV
jgi:hypothetical protein